MTRIRLPAGIWAAWLLSFALLLWVADGISGMEASPGYAGHYYEYLVEGFLHGHTSLSVAPAPQLALLGDPYDPAQNAPYRLSDASYYKGRYYLYYGPTPAVVLMLPWRLLTGQEMPERVAAAMFAALALAAMARLLWGIRMVYFPRLSGWVVGAVLFVAMHAAWLPVTLRRPGFWELPHAAALACLWWTFYFLWRFRRDGGLGWAVAMGISLALLVGSRVTFVFAAAAIPLLALVPPPGEGLGSAKGRQAMLRAAIAIGSPLALGGLALALYNVERFGRIGEFGQSYQLLNVDELHVQHFRPTFIPFNLWIYLGSLPELSPYFPFFKTVWPASMPPGYVMSEEMHGALFALPVLLAGFVTWAWVWQRRREGAIPAIAVTAAAATVTSLLAAAILFSWAGATSRYLTELLGGWTLVASVGLLVIFDPTPIIRKRGGPIRLLALLASAWTVGYVWLASFEHGGLFRRTNPWAYTQMARVLDYPSLWQARRDGIVFGPAELTIGLAPFDGPKLAVLLAAGRKDMLSSLVLTRVDKDHVRLSLMQNDTVLVSLDAVADPAGKLTVRIEAPWLYPPPESPYWDRFPNALERRDRQTRFALACGGRSVAGYSEFSFDATRFEPFELGALEGGVARIASLRRLSSSPP